MSTAKVTNIAAVRAFKAALIEFLEEATAALEMMNMQLHRTRDWVEHERPAYWTKQIQVGFERLSQARAQLTTCQMRTVAGRRPACIEEKQAYERAKRRLARCQETVGRVKQWSIKLTHESDEFRGRMAAFARCIETDLPRMIALIERTATALERYADVPRSRGEESQEQPSHPTPTRPASLSELDPRSPPQDDPQSHS